MRQNQLSYDYSDSENLSELKKDVNLPSSLLVHIVSDDDHFIEKLKELNESGISSILQQRYHEAIVYLQEAEKMLEFAANCGKSIDRILIIYTLHNEACGYQGLWEFEKASNYLQAIIFNMNSYVESAPELVMMSEILDSFSQSYNDFSLFIHKRQHIALNFLKFSALNSQLKKHQIAIDSAFKALSTLKLICEECYNYQQYCKKSYSSAYIRVILKELSGVKKTVDIKKMNQYFQLVQKYLIKIKNKTPQTQYKKAIKELDQFSIGEVMQLKPVSLNYLSKVSSLEQEISYIQKMYKTIYISICYFTVATELRFICNAKYGEEQKRKTPQFLRSKLFHLNAIIIACKYLPKKIDFIDHLLKTFATHYDIKLEESTHSYSEQFIDENNLIVHVDIEQKFNDSKILKNCKLNTFQSKQSLKFIKTSKKPRKKREKSQNKRSRQKCKSFEKLDHPISIKSYFNTRKKLFESDNKSKSKDKEKSKRKLKMSPVLLKVKEKQKMSKLKSLIKTKPKRDLSRQKSSEKKNNKLIEYFTNDKTKKKGFEQKMGNIFKLKNSERLRTSESFRLGNRSFNKLSRI